MASRNVPVEVINGDTSTGISSVAQFGEAVRFVGVHIDNPSTKAITATLEGSVSNSTGWVTLLSATAIGDSTGVLSRLKEMSSTGAVGSGQPLGLVDKARLNLSANATTGVLKVWLLGY